MSLLRLLSAGKSLVGMDDAATRYRDAGAGALPRFGSKKNPFRTTVKSERAPAEPKQGSATPAAPSAAGTPEVGARGPKSVENTDERGGASLPGATASAGAAERPTPLGGVPGQLREPAPRAARNPLSRPPSLATRALAKLGECWDTCATRLGGWFTRGPQRGKPALPQFNASAMQTEMSLDSVKVLRNDLSETDLELVPAKALVKSSAAAAKPKVENQPPAKAQLQLPAVAHEPERVAAGKT